MRIFEASIDRLMKSRQQDAGNLAEQEQEHTMITNINLQNTLSLEDISDGFERESLRYLHSLELT